MAITPLDPNILEAVASSLRAGQYSLLLGAGVSLDSRNRNNDLLPSAKDFRLELCRLKNAHEGSSLQRVYSTLTPSEVKQHVITRFLQCKPGPSLQKLPKFLWRRIFTFNIDDALEAAYEQADALQIPALFHFEDDYSDSAGLSELPIVHLHGWVGKPGGGFVFSRSEYVRQMDKINPWMVLLSQVMPVEPFIIAGTSLDEVDLDFYLAKRTAVSSREDRGPSILVEPFPDSITESDCKKYNLTLFQGTTEQFLDYIDSAVPNRPVPIDLVHRRIKGLFPAGTSKNTVLSFSSDFDLVPGLTTAGTELSKFLYGHLPTWKDLEGNVDIARKLTGSLVTKVENIVQDKRRDGRIILIADDTGSGKSTVIRRVAFELAKRGSCVLSCSALSRIDPQATAAAIDLIDDPVLIVVDNFADQVSAIGDMIRCLEKKDFAVLAAERSYRLRYIGETLSGLPFSQENGLALNNVETERLIDLYLREGLLGASEAVRSRTKFVHEISRDPIAVACCRILNDFRPLDRIVDTIVKATSADEQKRYFTAALAQHCFRGGVRYDVLASIGGRAGWNEQFEPGHPMPLAYFEGSYRNFVVPLNGTLATRILQRAKQEASETLLGVFVDLANAIAPRVNRGAIRRRSPEARLAGRLFDYDQVTSNFLGDSSATLYAETQPAWQWNSRYWEQVALLHLARYHASPSTVEGKEALVDAVQHARHAVSIEHHPLPLTTLGKILLAQLGQEGLSLTATFEEAFARLTDAIALERSWTRMSIHPFISLFRGTREYIDCGGILTGSESDELRRLTREASTKFRRDQEMEEVIAQIVPVLQ